MTVSVGTISSMMMTMSHWSRNGNLIFARAYPASPFTTMLRTIRIAA